VGPCSFTADEDTAGRRIVGRVIDNHGFGIDIGTAVVADQVERDDPTCGVVGGDVIFGEWHVVDDDLRGRGNVSVEICERVADWTRIAVEAVLGLETDQRRTFLDRPESFASNQ